MFSHLLLFSGMVFIGFVCVCVLVNVILILTKRDFGDKPIDNEQNTSMLMCNDECFKCFTNFYPILIVVCVPHQAASLYKSHREVHGFKTK